MLWEQHAGNMPRRAGINVVEERVITSLERGQPTWCSAKRHRTRAGMTRRIVSWHVLRWNGERAVLDIRSEKLRYNGAPDPVKPAARTAPFTRSSSYHARVQQCQFLTRNSVAVSPAFAQCTKRCTRRKVTVNAQPTNAECRK